MNAYLNGATSFKKEIINKQNQINQIVKTIEKENTQYQKDLEMDERWARLSKSWQVLKKSSFNLTPAHSFAKHTVLANQILEYISYIGDVSHLITDPELETYYLMDSIVNKIPFLSEKYGLLRGLSSGIAAKKAITDPEHQQMVIFLAEANYIKGRLSDNIKRICKEESFFKGELTNYIENFNNASDIYDEILKKEIINKKNITISPQKMFSSGTVAIENSLVLLEQKGEILDKLLQKRKNRYSLEKWLALLLTLFFLSIIAYLQICFYTSLIKSILTIRDKSKQIAQGDLSLKIALDTKDEFQIISSSINLLTQNFNKFLEREKLFREVDNEIIIRKTIKEAAEYITKTLARVFNVDQVIFRHFDPVSNVLLDELVEYRKNKDIFFSASTTLCAKEVSNFYEKNPGNKKILIIDDIPNQDIPASLYESLKVLKAETLAIIPMSYKETPIGVIFILSITSPKAYSEDELSLLKILIDQIAPIFYLFKLNEKLQKSLLNEKNIRRIIFECGKMDDHNKIYNYVLANLIQIFNVERAMHIHIDENSNLVVNNEQMKNNKIKSLLHEKLLCKECTFEIQPPKEEIFVINDVNQSIDNLELKKFLLSNKICSLLVYPSSKITFYGEESYETTVICCSYPRKWTEYEIQHFKLLIDSILLAYLENKNKKQIEQMRKDFTAALTHDLKGPIIAEQKAVELILSKGPDKKLGDYTELIEGIKTTNDNLLSILNNLSALYYYESECAALNLKLTNIKNLINNTVLSLKSLAEAKSSGIEIKAEDNLPDINIDDTEITRVLTNLIINALEHNKPQTKIVVEALHKEEAIEITVQDNGKGITEEEKVNIFKKYVSEKGKVASGLGLYISKHIIERHRGKIWLETQEGKGTTFYFTLPIK